MTCGSVLHFMLLAQDSSTRLQLEMKTLPPSAYERYVWCSLSLPSSKQCREKVGPIEY